METVTINFNEVSATKIRNKYDLMRLNTPSYASTLIEWDTGKMGKISRNRVLRWLKSGVQTQNGGGAVAVYSQLIKNLDVPRIIIDPHLLDVRKAKDAEIGTVAILNPPDNLIEALEEAYTASKILCRLKGTKPYHFQYESVRKALEYWGSHRFAHINLVPGVPMDNVLAAVDRMTKSEEYKDKIREAIEFIEQGKKLYFKYN